MKRFKERELQVWGILAIAVIVAWGITVGMLYENHRTSEEGPLMKKRKFLEIDCIIRFSSNIQV